MTEAQAVRGREVRVRFCPSPTGNPHVGMVRTALFNWAFARHVGGTFVFRIEDTDSARDTEQSYQDLLDALRWLGLDWDEGPEVGGPYGPYRQSERMGVYTNVAAQLVARGLAYECYCSPHELEGRRDAARAAGRASGYDGHCRELPAAAVADFRDQGRAPVIRLRMPADPVSWTDLVRGPLTVEVQRQTPDGVEFLVPDYVIVRANGEPLYPLVNPVDDAMMRITHVLRGEDLLSSTPRQLVMYDALRSIGVATGERPEFGHLPYVMGEGNRKLSKRDAESSLNMYREQGFLPAGLLNYLALLGWSLPRGYPLPADPPPSADRFEDADPQQRPRLEQARERDVFSVAELVAAFGMTEANARRLATGDAQEAAAALADPAADLSRVNPNPARFDLKKCTAINAEHIRWTPDADLAAALVPVLRSAGLIAAEPTAREMGVLAAAVPLVKERMQTLGEAPGMLGFLLVSEDAFAVAPEDAAAAFSADGLAALRAAEAALAGLTEWTTAAISDVLRSALVDGLGLKPRKAFAAVRVAVSGRRVSPPLFESMEILGRERTVSRIARAVG